MAALDSTRRRLRRFVVYVLLGIVGVEIINSARMLSTPVPNRHFPEQYVTKGIWTPYALIRPPHPTGADFTQPLRAARCLLDGNPDLYEGFSREGWHFVYPPTAVVLLAPFGLIAGLASDGAACRCFDLFSRLIALATAIATLFLLRGIIHTWRGWLMGLLVIAAFFPIRWGICCVNVQVLINALLVGAILACAASRGMTCGLLLGLACAFKPHIGIVVLFIFARREWKTGLTALATTAGLGIIACLALGTAPWFAYVRDVLPQLSAGYATHGNQTLLGALRRWLGDPTEINLVPLTMVVKVFWLTVSAVLIAAALVRRGSGSNLPVPEIATDAQTESSLTLAPADALYRIGDMSIACFVCLIASPISWDHHYGWAVVAFCMCLAAAVKLDLPAWLYLLIGLCYILMGTDWVPFAANQPGLISLLDSPKLFAALILSVILWFLCRRLGAETNSLRPVGPGLQGG